MDKYRLDEMSWMEAEDAFQRSDTAIIPVGTLHAHGPTPIGIDAISVEALANRVGKDTGLMVLPVLAYGENDKMQAYPGSITIRPGILEQVYTDIFRSLHRNGIGKVIALNGHGGNREPLLRAGRNVREAGMLVAIVEWWAIQQALMADLFPEGTHITELAVAMAVGGTEIADLRGGGYQGEWGINPPLRRIFGETIIPLGFNTFEYAGAPIAIPVDAWDIDVASPPEIGKAALEDIRRRGEGAIERLSGYIAAFAKELATIDVARAWTKSTEETKDTGRVPAAE
jgi:Creatinine amidohydrolase